MPLAIPNSPVKPRPQPLVAARLQRLLASAAALLLLAFPAVSPAADTNNTPRLLTPADFATYAKKNFWDANARFHRRNHDPQEAWRFARACFDLADFATNNTERAEIAEQGIAACRGLIEKEPGSAEAHYYLGMSYAQLAQTKSLGALKLVDQMEEEFLLVRGIDASLDYAGADRNLGLLYRDAPSFGSIGSRTKAKQHLQKAVELAPEYPENRLNLIEAYLKWNDRVGARRELRGLEEIMPKARTNLVGDAWACSWFDWQNRFQKVKKKIEEPSRAIESPRQKEP
jgi:tetratricopeptide (TPR) repeat protein